jgi:hypothetical protein
MVAKLHIPDLNRLILSMAPCYEASPHAPQTDQELFARHLGGKGALIRVWDGASDGSIYGDARVNHAFRAWHDSCHVIGRFPFTLQGETDTCELQIAQARQAWPNMPEVIARAIRCEVIGQADYFTEHGYFPEDQAAFFRSYMKDAF